MEPDFYEEPTASTFPQLRDTFEVRQRKWNYDLDKKQYLEWIFERDNYDRMLWFLASSKRTESPARVEKLARRSMDTDSTNLQLVSRILSESGYPRKSKVGDKVVHSSNRSRSAQLMKKASSSNEYKQILLYIYS